MSTIVAPRVRETPATRRVPAATVSEGRRERREQVVLFLGLWAAYSAIGYRFVVQHHVFAVDSSSRFAHAFFIWHNDPPKLAAVGFIWAPISTLIFLPAAVLRSLSTGLAGMPLTTAAFGAALVVVLYRTLRSLEMPKLQALALVLAFGGNPMIVFYSVNGMSEVPYLFFLTFALFQFVMWFLRREPRYLIVCGIMVTLGFLTRYEVLLWGLLLVPVLTVAMIRQRVSRDYLEGALIAFLAPIAYGLGLWIFLNWLIQGNAFYWLSPQTGAVPSGVQVAGPAAVNWGIVEALRGVGNVYWLVFAPTLPVLAALGVTFVVRRGRDLMLPTLALVLLLNIAFITALTVVFHAPGNLQLRYNMRDMPLTVVAMGWLYLVAGGPWRRHLVWAACLVSIAASYPLSWHAMRTYPYQFLEQAFTRSVAQDRTQEGTQSIGCALGGDPPTNCAQYKVEYEPAEHMARYIAALHLRKNAILTDDAQSFWAMLACGCPSTFLDRIDQGDAHWLDVLERPVGRVRYLLLTTNYDDKIHLRYPSITTEGLPWAHVVRHDSNLYLVRIAKRS